MRGEACSASWHGSRVESQVPHTRTILRNIEVPWDKIQWEEDILDENSLGTQNILASFEPVDEGDILR
ncbi:hypothetical protein PISMIDRAFT_688948 [Pisolithus microcarpus 441]|uniref:Uncharacterized protein n=1 Tax=Pisolithus microcarpus 441 TaxID=765257 RepID=A0A0C9YZ68_9AGAM|nr:hypothetical protein PISMIDRAFT_688948 [Pisolithus microcarpus 441]